MRFHILCVAVAFVVVAASNMSAATLSMEAFDNATVQPGGPRSGSSGKAFFNVEGSGNGSFASYGVADFNFGPQAPITAINSATLQITQSNASFTTDGGLVISLDSNTPPSDIQPGTSPLAFDGTDPGTGQDVTDGDLVLAAFTGAFSFAQVANGNVDSYSLGLTPSLSTALLNRLNSGNDIRIVIGTGDSTVAATWAGFSNLTYDGPTLVLDVQQVPEPAAITLLALGLFGLIWRRPV